MNRRPVAIHKDNGFDSDDRLGTNFVALAVDALGCFKADAVDELVPFGYHRLPLPQPPGPRNAGGLPLVIGKSVGTRSH